MVIAIMFKGQLFELWEYDPDFGERAYLRLEALKNDPEMHTSPNNWGITPPMILRK
mgnify:FL=1